MGQNRRQHAWTDVGRWAITRQPWSWDTKTAWLPGRQHACALLYNHAGRCVCKCGVVDDREVS